MQPVRKDDIYDDDRLRSNRERTKRLHKLHAAVMEWEHGEKRYLESKGVSCKATTALVDIKSRRIGWPEQSEHSLVPFFEIRGGPAGLYVIADNGNTVLPPLEGGVPEHRSGPKADEKGGVKEDKEDAKGQGKKGEEEDKKHDIESRYPDINAKEGTWWCRTCKSWTGRKSTLRTLYCIKEPFGQFVAKEPACPPIEGVVYNIRGPDAKDGSGGCNLASCTYAKTSADSKSVSSQQESHPAGGKDTQLTCGHCRSLQKCVSFSYLIEGVPNHLQICSVCIKSKGFVSKDIHELQVKELMKSELERTTEARSWKAKYESEKETDSEVTVCCRKWEQSYNDMRAKYDDLVRVHNTQTQRLADATAIFFSSAEEALSSVKTV